MRNRGSARTGRRPRKLGRYSSKYHPTATDLVKRPLRAPRANRVFRADEKHIRTENTVLDKGKCGTGWLFSKFRRHM